MVKASSNSAMDLTDLADRKNEEAEARRIEIINDIDESVRIFERGLKRRNHPEIYKLDTMVVMTEQATRVRKDAHTAKNEPDDEFPLLRSFGYGVIFTMVLFWIAELIVWWLR